MKSENPWSELPFMFHPMEERVAVDLGVCGKMDISNSIWERNGKYYLVNDGSAHYGILLGNKHQVQKVIKHCPGCGGELPEHIQ